MAAYLHTHAKFLKNRLKKLEGNDLQNTKWRISEKQFILSYITLI